jgi:hypothetical protein
LKKESKRTQNYTEERVNDLILNDHFQSQYHGIVQQETQLQLMKILLQHKLEYSDKALVLTDALLKPTNSSQTTKFPNSPRTANGSTFLFDSTDIVDVVIDGGAGTVFDIDTDIIIYISRNKSILFICFKKQNKKKRKKQLTVNNFLWIIIILNFNNINLIFLVN